MTTASQKKVGTAYDGYTAILVRARPLGRFVKCAMEHFNIRERRTFHHGHAKSKVLNAPCTTAGTESVRCDLIIDAISFAMATASSSSSTSLSNEAHYFQAAEESGGEDGYDDKMYTTTELSRLEVRIKIAQFLRRLTDALVPGPLPQAGPDREDDVDKEPRRLELHYDAPDYRQGLVLTSSWHSAQNHQSGEEVALPMLRQTTKVCALLLCYVLRTMTFLCSHN